MILKTDLLLNLITLHHMTFKYFLDQVKNIIFSIRHISVETNSQTDVQNTIENPPAELLIQTQIITLINTIKVKITLNQRHKYQKQTFLRQPVTTKQQQRKKTTTVQTKKKQSPSQQEITTTDRNNNKRHARVKTATHKVRNANHLHPSNHLTHRSPVIELHRVQDWVLVKEQIQVSCNPYTALMRDIGQEM